VGSRDGRRGNEDDEEPDKLRRLLWLLFFSLIAALFCRAQYCTGRLRFSNLHRCWTSCQRDLRPTSVERFNRRRPLVKNKNDLQLSRQDKTNVVTKNVESTSAEIDWAWSEETLMVGSMIGDKEGLEQQISKADEAFAFFEIKFSG